MKRAIINPVNCKNCGECAVVKVCDKNAIIREEKGDSPWIDFYRCCGCLKCKAACQFNAVEEISQPCTGKPRMGW